MESRDSVGTVLRRAREHYGEDLRSVAEALKIRYVHLLSIEEGRFKDLPGTTYAVGFIRTYAEYLGLDSEDLVYRFKEEVDSVDARQELVFPTPPPEGKVPGGALILISVLLVALAYGTWFYLSSQGKSIADLVPAVPERLTALIEGEDEAAETEAPGSEAEPAKTTAEPAGEPGDATPASSVEEPAQPAAVAAPEPEPAVATDEASEGDTLSQTAPSAVVRGSGLVPREPTAPKPDDPGSRDELTMAELTDRPSAPGVARPEVPPLATTTATGAAAKPSDRLPEASDSEPAPTPSSGATSGTPVTLARVLKTPAQTPEPSPSAEAGAAGESAIPAAPAATQVATANAGREPQVYGADNVDARIVLRATQDSWVQVRDSDDDLLITRVLRSGDEYRVPNRVGLTLLTGNAGGIEIVVDGARLSPIGPVGAVRRDVALDPEQLKRGTASSQ